MTKECVACAEQIQETAKLCRYCNTDQQNSAYALNDSEQGQAAEAKTSTTCRVCFEDKQMRQRQVICDECFDVSEYAPPSHPISVPRKSVPNRRTSSSKGIAIFLALAAGGVLWWGTSSGMFSFNEQPSNRNNSNTYVPPDYGNDADVNLDEGGQSAPSGYYKDVCQWVTTAGGGDAYGMNGNGQVATVKVRECRQVWVED